MLRPQDRLIASELEPRAAASLKNALRGDPRVKVLAIDGWIAIKANVPPKERRGLVLIDPPYEDAFDFNRLTEALGEAHRKWPTGIYMLWYPIKERDAPDALARRLRRLGVAKVLRSEIALAPRRTRCGTRRFGSDRGQSASRIGAGLRDFAPRTYTGAIAERGAAARLARRGTTAQRSRAGGETLARKLLQPAENGRLPLFHTCKLG